MRRFVRHRNAASRVHVQGALTRRMVSQRGAKEPLLRICNGLRMARTPNNTKRQDCGHDWWSIRILTSYSWKRNTCLCHQVKDASNVLECQMSDKLESQGDGSWQPNNIREIPQLRNMKIPKVSENGSQEPQQSPKHYKARSSSTSANDIFIIFAIPFPKLRNPSRAESLKVTDMPIG